MTGIIHARVLAAVLGTVVSFPTAAGQSLCGPHDILVAELETRFGEVVVFRGRHPTEPRVMEVLHNAATGTFTVLVTDATASCITATGRDATLGGTTAPGQPS
jgi:hypothetical protein